MLFGDATHQKAVRDPDSVSAFRISGVRGAYIPERQSYYRLDSIREFATAGLSPRDYPPEPDARYFQGYPIMSGPVPVSKKAARSLSELLLNPDSFPEPSPTLCPFSPAVGLRFKRGDASVDVLVCFNCTELAVSAGSHEAGASFDPIAGEMRRIIDSFLPFKTNSVSRIQ